MLGKLLSQDAPPSIKEVKVIFPVVGHSFIPPDRVFGHIEAEVKKHSTLLTDHSYINIIKLYATVIRFGKECPVFEWKEAVSQVTKEPGAWHFKLKPCKRIILRKTKAGSCIVRGEMNYNVDTGEGKSILKHGKLYSSMLPRVIDIGTILKKEKILDLQTLVTKHFGTSWMENEELFFFKNIFQQQKARNEPLVECNSDFGDTLEEEEGLVVKGMISLLWINYYSLNL